MYFNPLYFVIVLLAFVNLVVGAALKPEDTSLGLYSLKDDVEILTGDNLKRSIYNSNRIWLVEFYSSWCGFCQRFAPTWKQFATDIKSWKDVIAIAAINCADEINSQLCIEFTITGFPSVKYFPDRYEEKPENLGWIISPGVSAYDHRKSLLKFVMLDQIKRDNTILPNLQPYIGEYSDIFNSVTSSQQYCTLIIQDPNDTVGPEMVLDFRKVKDLCVKFAYKNNTNLVKHLETNEFPSAYLVERDNLNSPLLLTVYSPDRKGFSSTIRRLLLAKNINVPEDIDTNVTAVDNNDSATMFNLSNTGVDSNVFQMDLENALRYSLKREIGMIKSISGEKLQALRKYLSVLEKYFPLGTNGKLLLKQIVDFVNKSQTIDGTEISKMVKDSEKTAQIFSSPQNWIGCKGSTPYFRGYPCGLWKMFHYLTVNAAIQGNSITNSNPKDVLETMYEYVKNFFGCIECSNHFQEMAIRRKIFEVNTWDGSILWLWKAHNEVNRRLAGDSSEDPHHPKIQFPSKRLCPNCFSPDDTFNEIEVLMFLKEMYSQKNIKYDGSDVNILNLGATSQNPRIYSTSVLTTLSVMGIFILSYFQSVYYL